MFKGLFYFLGSIVFALILNQKLYELTGKNLLDIIGTIVRVLTLVLKGAGAD